MLKHLYIFFIFSSTILSAQVSVDGYVKQPGEASMALSYTFDFNQKYYAEPGIIPFQSNYQSFSVYQSFGIFKNVEVSAALPYVKNVGSASLQDASLFAKISTNNIKLKKSKMRLLFAGGHSFPVTDYDILGSRALGQQAVSFTLLGMAQVEFENGVFILGQVGYVLNKQPVPEAGLANLRIGKGSGKNYYHITAYAREAFGGNSYRDGTNSPFNTFGFTQYGLEATFFRTLYKQTGFYISARKNLYGKNAFNTLGATVGLNFGF